MHFENEPDEISASGKRKGESLPEEINTDEGSQKSYSEPAEMHREEEHEQEQELDPDREQDQEEIIETHDELETTEMDDLGRDSGDDEPADSSPEDIAAAEPEILPAVSESAVGSSEQKKPNPQNREGGGRRRRRSRRGGQKGGQRERREGSGAQGEKSRDRSSHQHSQQEKHVSREDDKGAHLHEDPEIREMREEEAMWNLREEELAASEGMPQAREEVQAAAAAPAGADAAETQGQDDKEIKPLGFIRRMIRKLVGAEEPSHKELIINCEMLERRVALLEKGQLEEFNIERTNERRIVGSIYKGRIKNLEPGLKAAFVDIGLEKNAFLHYWDIVPNEEKDFETVEKAGRPRRESKRISLRDIPNVYPPGTEIIVQVTKGPISTKGPRVTTNVSLPGRYLVLTPFTDQLGISRKIDDPKERDRLRKILQELDIPEGMGVIIRTVGEEQKARYFVRDLRLMLDHWAQVQEKIKNSQTPSCVWREPNLVERTVRDFLTEDIDRIIVDDEKEYNHIRNIVGAISWRSKQKVKIYNEPVPIFQKFNIEKQIENAFRRQVWLKCGGYIVIDETEALVAIDVNTGRHKTSKESGSGSNVNREHESTILRTNLEAADEICRQIRLRNIGGLIICDFIDMKSRRDQQQVYQRMKENLKRDKAKTHVLPISSLGLMEMTRQRTQESVQAAIFEDCPYCKGKGIVKSTLSISVEIQRKLVEIMRKHFANSRDREEDFQLRVDMHPVVLHRIHTEDSKIFIEMEKKYFGKMSFRADDQLHLEEFKIFNAITNQELN